MTLDKAMKMSQSYSPMSETGEPMLVVITETSLGTQTPKTTIESSTSHQFESNEGSTTTKSRQTEEKAGTQANQDPCTDLWCAILSLSTEATVSIATTTIDRNTESGQMATKTVPKFENELLEKTTQIGIVDFTDGNENDRVTTEATFIIKP